MPDDSHSSEPIPLKQGTNRVATGFTVQELAEIITNSAASWVEKDQLSVLLLRAMCALIQSRPDQADEGFVPQEIADQMNHILGKKRPWPGKDADVSEEVRRLWKKLETIWDKKKEGLNQLMLDQGFNMVPIIGKTQSPGGPQRPSRYWIHSEPSSSNEVSERKYEIPACGLRYVCEDIEDAGWLARIFAKGYRMSGWRRWIYIAILIGYIMTVLALVLIADLAMMAKVPLKDLLYLSIGSIGIACALWITFHPLFAVGDWKIVVAPWWMQADNFHGNRLLEWRYPPRHPEKMIRAVRYSGKCPICLANVTACSGGLEFGWKRIVGRCEESPSEHVFAFDHVTRVGKPLR